VAAWSAGPGVEHSKRFRGVAEAIAALAEKTLVLDGEIAIFDQQLRSRSDWLRSTLDKLATPPVYIAFDMLYRAGKDETDSTGGCSWRGMRRTSSRRALPRASISPWPMCADWRRPSPFGMWTARRN
jgi:hypothetical protein